MKISQARVDGLIDDAKKIKISGGITTKDVKVGGNITMGGGSGTNNYEKLINKPQINNIELLGNKTSKQLKLQDEMDLITEQDIDEIMYGG